MIPTVLFFAYDLESMRICPRADGSFEERREIREGRKFIVLRKKFFCGKHVLYDYSGCKDFSP